MLLTGASSAAGLALLSLFAAQPGCHVTAVTRSERRHSHALTSAGAHAVLQADCTDASSLHAALHAAQPHVVVHLAGSAPTAGCSGGDATMLRCTVDACLSVRGVARFVFVSALGCEETSVCLPGASLDVLQPWLQRKEQSESYLIASGLEYCVLRPGPLRDGAPTGQAVTSRDADRGQAYSALSRSDLAHVLFAAALSRTATRTVLSVLDASAVIIASPSLRTLEPWESLPFQLFEL